MSSEQENLGSFSNIDPLMLDKHWVDQTEIYLSNAMALADARKKLEESKEEYDNTRARIEMKIRKDPEKFDLSERPTESAIQNRLQLHSSLQGKRSELITLRSKVEKAQAIVTAIEHRKRALTMLVALHGQDYFSNPTSSDTNKRKAKEGVEQSRAKRRVIGRIDLDDKD